MIIIDGWHYSEDRTFRRRFPEWFRVDETPGYQLYVECATLIDGRWEWFISLYQVFWIEGELVDLQKEEAS